MTTLLKLSAAALIFALAAIVGLCLIGRLLLARGQLTETPGVTRTFQAIALSLFAVMAVAIVPIFARTFLFLQGRIGNGDLGPIRFLRTHELWISLIIWLVWGAGLAVAWPTMRRDLLGYRPPPPPSKGVLSLNIGMSLDEVAAASTLAIHPPIDNRLTGTRISIAETTFDLEIAGAAIRFPQCRYYCIETRKGADPRLDHINVGVSPQAVGPADLAAALEETRGLLTADGWAPGRFIYPIDESRSRRTGVEISGEGLYWAKADTLLILSTKRIDDAKPDEDPATAGRFILYIDLVPRDSSTYVKLSYGPPPQPAPETPR